MAALSEELSGKGPKYYSPGPPEGGEFEKPLPEEDESIKRQLRDMGYLTD